MSDLFHENRQTEIIGRVCATIALSDHIGELLTKRTARMAEYFTTLDRRTLHRWQPQLGLGFSAERRREFDTRWTNIRPLADAGWIIFVSIAPMIGPVILPPDFLALRDRGWVIVAGEHGPHADCRDMDPNWARYPRSVCCFWHRLLHEATGEERADPAGFVDTPIPFASQLAKAIAQPRVCPPAMAATRAGPPAGR
jgi:protein gp37